MTYKPGNLIEMTEHGRYTIHSIEYCYPPKKVSLGKIGNIPYQPVIIQSQHRKILNEYSNELFLYIKHFTDNRFITFQILNKKGLFYLHFGNDKDIEIDKLFNVVSSYERYFNTSD